MISINNWKKLNFCSFVTDNKTEEQVEHVRYYHMWLEVVICLSVSFSFSALLSYLIAVFVKSLVESTQEAVMYTVNIETNERRGRSIILYHFCAALAILLKDNFISIRAWLLHYFFICWISSSVTMKTLHLNLISLLILQSNFIFVFTSNSAVLSWLPYCNRVYTAVNVLLTNISTKFLINAVIFYPFLSISIIAVLRYRFKPDQVQLWTCNICLFGRVTGKKALNQALVRFLIELIKT